MTRYASLTLALLTGCPSGGDGGAGAGAGDAGQWECSEPVDAWYLSYEAIGGDCTHVMVSADNVLLGPLPNSDIPLLPNPMCGEHSAAGDYCSEDGFHIVETCVTEHTSQNFMGVLNFYTVEISKHFTLVRTDEKHLSGTLSLSYRDVTEPSAISGGAPNPDCASEYRVAGIWDSYGSTH